MNYCVLIPTYNNDRTLTRVIEGVLKHTPNIIVINDGATDSTALLLKNYQQLEVITLPANRGKGNALQVGFERARELGYEYALTIDSDGQHYPEDIEVFLQAQAQATEPTLWVGSRNMQQEGVPKKSSFGHWFSNFWFQFETGVKLTDTQSGYRMYPLRLIPKRYYSKKFEFEIEVLVRSSWRGVPLKNVPVQVLYDPAERVSHFRPVRDFLRISVLNTILVLIAVFYIKPRDFIRGFRKKSFKRFIKEDVLESDSSDEVKAYSVALGLFFGLSPLWGLQTILTLALAVFLKLNKTLAFVCSNVSIPPMIPVLMLASMKVGSFFVGGEVLPRTTDFTMDYAKEFIKDNLLQYLVGSAILSTTVAITLGVLTYLMLKLSHKKGS